MGDGGRRRSEDEPGEKWDRCVADVIIKTGAESLSSGGAGEGICNDVSYFN